MCKKITFLTALLPIAFFFQLKAASIIGLLQNEQGEAIAYVNVALYVAQDSSFAKIEVSDDIGKFKLQSIEAGNYFLVASYVGYSDIRIENIALTKDQQLDLEILDFQHLATELAQATVIATREMVEVKGDRMVFNVQGTTNSAVFYFL